MSEPQQQAQLTARLGLAGVLEFKDDHGNVLKTVPFEGSLPFSLTDAPAEPALPLVPTKGD